MHLNEGLLFFKESEKLDKLISSMEYNLLNNIADNKQREELREYINNVKDAKKEFGEVESEYRNGNKKEARKQFNKLKKKYGAILTRVDRPILNLFKRYGSSIMYFATMQLVSRMLMPKFSTTIDREDDSGSDSGSGSIPPATV